MSVLSKANVTMHSIAMAALVISLAYRLRLAIYS